MTTQLEPVEIGILVVGVCISLVILFGNIITIVAIVRYKKLNTAPNQFIIGLAMADLLVAICLPYNITTSFLYKEAVLHKHSEFVTRCLLSFVPPFFSTVWSCFNLLLIGVDRYFCVSHPFIHRVYLTRKNARRAVGGACILAAIFASPPIYWNNWSAGIEGNCDTWALKFEYFLGVVLPSYLASVVLLIFVYIRVLRVASSKFKDSNQPFKVVTIVLSCYCVCWLPNMTCMFLVLYSKHTNQPQYKVSDEVFALTFMLACCNSFMNPIIYAFKSEDYKQAFKHILRFKEKDASNSTVLETVSGNILSSNRDEKESTVSNVETNSLPSGDKLGTTV